MRRRAVSGTGAVFYLHTDRLGTVQVATGTGGAVAWQGAYQPFGTVTAAQGLLAQNLRFLGQYADAKTGWSQNGWRDYDPAIGRYLEADPIGLDGGVSLYAYVGNDPTSVVDPSGLCGAPYTTPHGAGYSDKIAKLLAKRGWTPQQIDDAKAMGSKIAATNKANGNPATRYVNPFTNQSVVIDDVTGEVVQVGGPGFDFGPESGDVPGATMQPPDFLNPGAQTTEAPAVNPEMEFPE